MNFNFNEVAEVKEGKRGLKPNTIHHVKFDGAELVNDVKLAAGGTGGVIDFKFSNENGSFTHRIFPTGPGDDQDKDNQWGGKNPSRLKSLMQMSKFLIKNLNPEFYAKLESGESTFGGKNWDGFRKFMVDTVNEGIGIETEIKLLVNNKGIACFPPYFLKYNTDNTLYISSYFIGKDLAFSDSEMKTIKTASSAKPTPASDEFSLNPSSEPKVQNNSDLDFEL